MKKRNKTRNIKEKYSRSTEREEKKGRREKSKKNKMKKPNKKREKKKIDFFFSITENKNQK
jgi:hypothetical protein